MKSFTEEYVSQFKKQPVSTTTGNVIQRDEPLVEIYRGARAVVYPIKTTAGIDTGLRVSAMA